MSRVVSVSCEMPNCGIADNRYLWKCEGCSRRFHAACVGVQRNQEELVRTYMLPACSDCQERVAMELNFKQLLHQQAILAELVKKHSEAIHRSTQTLQKVGVVHEALDRQEAMFDELKKELATAKRVASPTKTVNEIKCHVSSLFDDALNTVKLDVTESIGTLTDSLSRNLTSHLEHVLYKVDEQLENVNENLIDVAASSKCSAPEILEEVRIIGNEISKHVHSNQLIQLNDSIILPSIADELATVKDKTDEPAKSGWRILGNKRVWKHDWTEYDEKMTRRIQQQKEAAQARRRAKNRRRRRTRNYNRSLNNGIHNHSNNNNNTYTNSQIRRYNGNGYSNYRRNFNSNNYNNRNFTTIPYRTNYNNYEARFMNDNNNINRNSRNYNNNNSNSYDNLNFNKHNYHTNNNYNQLPPDRELLAAAKDRFSRPPPNHQPMHFQGGERINPANNTLPSLFAPTAPTHSPYMMTQFQKGETLNPYPVRASSIPAPSATAHSTNLMTPGTSSAPPCQTCTGRHLCFPQN